MISKLRKNESIIIEIDDNYQWIEKTLIRPDKKTKTDKVTKADRYFHKDPEFNYFLDSRFKTKDHQKRVFKWMDHRIKNPFLGIKGGIIAAKMGLGKTFIALGNTNGKTTNGPDLVICPLSVIPEWVSENEKFFGMKTLVYHKDYLGKSKYDNFSFSDFNKYDVIITVYDAIRVAAKTHKTYDHLFILDDQNRTSGISNPVYLPEYAKKVRKLKGPETLFYINFDNIYADESHTFSNPKSLLFYSVLSLHGENKWCLSGTPIKNYDTDIYPQLRFCGYSKTFPAKRFNYAEYSETNLRDAVMKITVEESGVKIPPPVRETIEIILKDEEKILYDLYFDAARDAYLNHIAQNALYANVLALFLRLRQICVASYVINKENSDKIKASKSVLDRYDLGDWISDIHGTAGIKSQKMSIAVNYIKNAPEDETIVVGSVFKSVTNLLAFALREEGISYLQLDGTVRGADRSDVINKFKENKTRVLLVTYKAGGQGLNLANASIIIRMDGWWCPAVLDQVETRLVRIGQTKNVKIVDIIVKDTIEEKMIEICNKKRELERQFMQGGKSGGIDASMMGQMLNFNT